MTNQEAEVPPEFGDDDPDDAVDEEADTEE
jgi:hypothetical protein